MGDPMTDPGGGEVSDAGARWRSSAAPLVLLFLSLAAVFLFGGDRSHLYRPAAWHDLITRNFMALASNMSPEHDFLGFKRLSLDDDGSRVYVPYNRFPVLGHVSIKLVALPFPDDTSARLFAARMLMLAFFVAAATIAYLALCRLVRNRWAALAATLLAFSSYYALFYNDMVAPEGMVDLFALMLVFHGMAVYATEGRFGQLPVKACVALLLGWHVYALVLPFVVLGAAVALRRRDGRAVRRHVALGVIALLFGSVVLGTNFAREHAALGGEVRVAELPSVQSMLKKTILGNIIGEYKLKHMSELAEQQLDRIGMASVPYAVSRFFSDPIPTSDNPAKSNNEVRRYMARGIPRVLSVLAVLSVLVLVFSPATRHRLPLAALILTGPCWAVVAHKSVIWHEHEGLFHIGIPLVLFALALARLDRLFRRGGGDARRRVTCSMLAGIAAAPMFLASSLLMARNSHDPEAAAFARISTADFDAIRKWTEGKTIFLNMSQVHDRRLTHRPSSFRYHSYYDYYLTGSPLIHRKDGKHFADFKHFVDFVLDGRLGDTPSLTPGNRLLFLYDRADYDDALRRYEHYAKHGAPILESPGKAAVHLIERNPGNELLYFLAHCPTGEIEEPGGHPILFLHVYPADTDDLHPDRRQYGFNGLDIPLDSLWRRGGACYAVRRLPDYGIAELHTGLSVSRPARAGGRSYDIIWDGRFSPENAGSPGSG